MSSDDDSYRSLRFNWLAENLELEFMHWEGRANRKLRGIKKKHCEETTNIYKYRREINACKQKENEKFIDFYGRLVEKSLLCHFERDVPSECTCGCAGKIRRNRLVDYIIAGVRDPKLRWHLEQKKTREKIILFGRYWDGDIDTFDPEEFHGNIRREKDLYS